MKVTRGFVALLVCLALTVPVLAQSSPQYDLSWHVIAGGGGRMAATGGHALLGTLGQPAVDVMSGAGYALCSGFWCGGVSAQTAAYLPLIVRGH